MGSVTEKLTLGTNVSELCSVDDRHSDQVYEAVQKLKIFHRNAIRNQDQA